MFEVIVSPIELVDLYLVFKGKLASIKHKKAPEDLNVIDTC